MTMALVAKRRYQDGRVGIGSCNNDARRETSVHLHTPQLFLSPAIYTRGAAASRRRGKPVNPRAREIQRCDERARRSPSLPFPPSERHYCEYRLVYRRDGVGRPGVCGTGNLEELGDMAVTARNAWNVARHAAPAQSHGAIHRPFGPLPIRFRCPSSFCRSHRRKQRIRLCSSELK